MSANAVKKKSKSKTKVVEIYQEGTVSLSVDRTIIAVVPKDWTDEEIEDYLDEHGSDVLWEDYDDGGAEADITQIKEISADDAEIDEDWSEDA